MSSSQAPYPSPLPCGHRLTRSAAPPLPAANAALTLRWEPYFPSQTLLETTKGRGPAGPLPLESNPGAGAFAWGCFHADASLRTGRGWDGHRIGTPSTIVPKFVIPVASLSAPLRFAGLVVAGECYMGTDSHVASLLGMTGRDGKFFPHSLVLRGGPQGRHGNPFFCWQFGRNSVSGRPDRAAPTRC